MILSEYRFDLRSRRFQLLLKQSFL